MAHTDILHEFPPPMLIDIALVVATAAEDTVPVAAMSIVVGVPISMSIFEASALKEGGNELGLSKIGSLAHRNGLRSREEQQPLGRGKGCQEKKLCLSRGNRTYRQSGYQKQDKRLPGQLRGSHRYTVQAYSPKAHTPWPGRRNLLGSTGLGLDAGMVCARLSTFPALRV